MKTEMTDEQKDAYWKIFETEYNGKKGTYFDCMHAVYIERQAEIEALQAKITEYAALLMNYEEKFDVIAENEGERMLEFGNAVLKLANEKARYCYMGCSSVGQLSTGIKSIDIKQLYTNFKNLNYKIETP